MLADFYITRPSNDMKITVEKHHLDGQILYRTLVPSKKTASRFLISSAGFVSFPISVSIWASVDPGGIPVHVANI